MKRYVLPILLACASPAPAQGVSFKKQVAPILAANCTGCHNAKTPQSGLSTASYAALVKGGTHGKAVVAGKPDESLLVQYVEGKKQPRMPIGGALKPEEIALLRKWVAEGAKSDGDAPAAPPTPAPPVKVRTDILPQAASLTWSKDGRWLLVGTYQEVRVFDAANGKPERALTGHADVVRALAVSPDGTTLAAGGGVPGVGGEVKLWNLATGKLVNTLTGHADCVYGVAWRPDGRQIATTSYDKTVKLWDVTAGKSVADLKDHADAVYAVGYSASGKYLATASGDRSIRVWDPATGKRLYTLAGHTEMVNALAFHPTADQLVTGGADKQARLWNLKPDGGDLVRTFNGLPEVITDLRFAPDGKSIVACCNDGTLRVFDPNRNDVVKTVQASPDAVLAVAIAPDSKTVAAGGYDGSARLYKAADWTVASTLIEPPAPKPAAAPANPTAKPTGTPGTPRTPAAKPAKAAK